MGKMVPAELDRSPPLSPEHVILVPGASKTASIPKSLPPFLASVLPIFSAAKGRVSKSTSEAKGVDWVVSEKNMRQKPASPLCLVVCGAALRCCELVPLMRKTNKLRGDSSGGHVSKLFAKHQKATDQAAELRRERPEIVVGTPGRLMRLLVRCCASTADEAVAKKLDSSSFIKPPPISLRRKIIGSSVGTAC